MELLYFLEMVGFGVFMECEGERDWEVDVKVGMAKGVW